ALAEELLDIAVLGPVRQATGIDLLDETIVDQRLLHATHDVDDFVGPLTAGGDEHVEHGGRGIADRDEIDVIAACALELRPVAAWIADPDIGEIDGAGRMSTMRADAESGGRGEGQGEAQGVTPVHIHAIHCILHAPLSGRMAASSVPAE